MILFSSLEVRLLLLVDEFMTSVLYLLFMLMILVGDGNAKKKLIKYSRFL